MVDDMLKTLGSIPSVQVCSLAYMHACTSLHTQKQELAKMCRNWNPY